MPIKSALYARGPFSQDFGTESLGTKSYSLTDLSRVRCGPRRAVQCSPCANKDSALRLWNPPLSPSGGCHHGRRSKRSGATGLNRKYGSDTCVIRSKSNADFCQSSSRYYQPRNASAHIRGISFGSGGYPLPHGAGHSSIDGTEYVGFDFADDRQTRRANETTRRTIEKTNRLICQPALDQDVAEFQAHLRAFQVRQRPLGRPAVVIVATGEPSSIHLLRLQDQLVFDDISSLMSN